MNKERIEQIIENVNKRNFINAICGCTSTKSDDEILELIDYIKELQIENKRLKVKIKKIIDALNYLDTDEKKSKYNKSNIK